MTLGPSKWAAMLLVMVIAACSGPVITLPTVTQPIEGSDRVRVFVSTDREEINQLDRFGLKRRVAPNYFSATVSIPPNHVPGNIELGTPPNPKRHFAIAASTRFETANSFTADINAALENSPDDNVLIFVHGYNTSALEATLRLGQIAHDYRIEMPVVAYSWPSSGSALGYIYDRDSALFARDGLEELIRMIHSETGRRVYTSAHSLGAYLTMETLRQMAIEDQANIPKFVAGLTLMSPDIDEDVFVAQIDRIETLPSPFLVYTTEDDRALRLSSFLTGRRPRLGTITNPEKFVERGVELVDLSRFIDDADTAHNVAFTSAKAMRAILRTFEPF